MKRFACAGMMLLAVCGMAMGQGSQADRAPAVAAEAEEFKLLRIGDDAPKLDHVTWVQGEAVEGFKAGQVYVLDFWATWCGPCVAAIPHMNELSKKHADDGVHVIGVAIWPRANMKPVKGFVEGKGDAMSYRIAEDDAAGSTADAYMLPTGSGGIPTVMIVNKEGKLAWLGHPMDGMDEALAQILDGSYDMAGAIEKNKAALEEMAPEIKQQYAMRKLSKQLDPIWAELEAAAIAEDWAKVVSLYDRAIAIDPSMLSHLYISQYRDVLLQLKDTAMADSVEKKILASKIMEHPQQLNALAWMIVDPQGPIPADLRDVEFAQQLAEKASDLTKHENAEVLDTLARVWFVKGDVAKAISLQEKAVGAAPEEMKPILEKTLEEYKAATTPS